MGRPPLPQAAGVAAGHPALKHLLVIGLYRDNEVGAAHPLSMSIEAITRAGAAVSTLTLQPLGPAEVGFVADTVHCDVAGAVPLARLVHKPTGGNPFFMGQLLRRLHEDGLIDWNPGAGLVVVVDGGHPHPRGDRGRGPADGRPPAEAARATRRVLELASCIGNRFDLGMLALVCERPPRETARDLYRALEEGLVLPRDEDWRLAEQGGADQAVYTFLHNRVQQAAYALIPEEALGAATPAHRPPAAGRDPARTAGGADLRHRQPPQPGPGPRGAGGRAAGDGPPEPGGRAAGAGLGGLESAMHYFDAGLALLAEDSWERDYPLTSAIHRGAMESAYLNGRIDRGEALSELLLARARTAVEKVEVHEALGELGHAAAGHAARRSGGLHQQYVGIEAVAEQHQLPCQRHGASGLDKLLRLELFGLGDEIQGAELVVIAPAAPVVQLFEIPLNPVLRRQCGIWHGRYLPSL